MKGLQHVLHRDSQRYSAAWEAVRASLGSEAAATIPQLGAVRLGHQLGVLTGEGTEGVKEVCKHEL